MKLDLNRLSVGNIRKGAKLYSYGDIWNPNITEFCRLYIRFHEFTVIDFEISTTDMGLAGAELKTLIEFVVDDGYGDELFFGIDSVDNFYIAHGEPELNETESSDEESVDPVVKDVAESLTKQAHNSMTRAV